MPVSRHCATHLVVVILAIIALASVLPVRAQSSEGTSASLSVTALQEMLASDRDGLDQLRADLAAQREKLPQSADAMTPDEATEAVINQARVDLDATELQIENTDLELRGLERDRRDLENRIGEVESRIQLLKNPAQSGTIADRDGQLAELTAQLERFRLMHGLLGERIDALTQRRGLQQERQQLLTRFRDAIEAKAQQRREVERRAQQEAEQERIAGEQQRRRQDLANLRAQLAREEDRLSDLQARLLRARIAVLEAQTRFEQMDLERSEAESQLSAAEQLLASGSASAQDLRQRRDQLKQSIDLLNAQLQLLERAQTVTGEQARLLAETETLNSSDRRAAKALEETVASVGEAVDQRLESVRSARARGEDLYGLLDAQYSERLSTNLRTRVTWPASAAGWRELMTQIGGAPRVIAFQIQVSVQSLWEHIRAARLEEWMVLAISLGLYVGGVLALRRMLRRRAREQRADASSFVSRAWQTGLYIARRNLLGVAIALALGVVLAVFRPPHPGPAILLSVVLIWVAIKLPVTVVWTLLAHPRMAARKRHLGLARTLTIRLVGAGLLGALVLLARLSAVPVPALDVFDRVFMLWMLMSLHPLWTVRRLIGGVLGNYFPGRFGLYVGGLITLFFLIAMGLAAILGVLGYLNLAWSMTWHLVVFLVVALAWVIARGLVGDASVWLKNLALSRTSHGLLWTQDVIAPLERVVQILLFLAIWPVLLAVYDLDDNTGVRGLFESLLESSLFTLGEVPITPWRIGVTVFIAFAVFWLGRWARSVTYRWVFSRVLDLGVRHSLSVFTQYFVVLVGLLILLRVIGIDLTTLTIFAGALGVGIGFGLQTVANNFISGVLLLIERPLRSGDTVQIGTHTGEINRIGIRSLTMRTWDNMDVIIPNSDVISHAFTNWTHTDNVVRTVLMQRISHDADLDQARQILERVVNGHKEILREPSPFVGLWEFTDSAVIYRIHYFTDFAVTNILAVRSEVLFQIWKMLKDAGIAIPFAQQDVYLRTTPPAFETLSRDQARAESGTVNLRKPLPGAEGAELQGEPPT